MSATSLQAQCCIAGGGPAGMMLGLLLARAGVEVAVLEKHADFLRDFRGDTIHPSTLEVMHELGLLEELLALPHQKARALTAQFGDMSFQVADFSRLPTRCKYIVLMPQWDFLNLLATHARASAKFKLLMQTEATDLIEESGRIVGVEATAPDGPLAVRADLVVAADGRHSTLRERAGLVADELGAPMDVLWFKLTRRFGDPENPLGRIDGGHVFVMIDRGDYWQCGFVIRKGGFARTRAQGLDLFRQSVAELAPFVADRVGEITDWEQIKLLTVTVDRLRRWHRPGMLCIGDAAHAMSPIGGVGINLAIQDAVATANALAERLHAGTLTDDDLSLVQRERAWPTHVTQRAQLFIQDRLIQRVLEGNGSIKPPLLIRLLARYPTLRRIPARLVGIGVRPEHVRSPAA
jgi:2-polyprenyl-6-methoxyphenol hydroxylase-like FAD-dependent oxidoreductase